MDDAPILPEEDSKDLTEDEVLRAVVTSDTQDISRLVVEELKAHPGTQLEGHDLRRQKPHLYWRVRLVDPDGTTRSLMFQADWLKR